MSINDAFTRDMFTFGDEDAQKTVFEFLGQTHPSCKGRVKKRHSIRWNCKECRDLVMKFFEETTEKNRLRLLWHLKRCKTPVLSPSEMPLGSRSKDLFRHSPEAVQRKKDAKDSTKVPKPYWVNKGPRGWQE